MTNKIIPSLLCSVCGGAQESAHILTEIQLEVISKYQHPDGSLEDMNGLWKKTRELLCEDCFNAYTKVLQNFYNLHRKPQL